MQRCESNVCHRFLDPRLVHSRFPCLLTPRENPRVATFSGFCARIELSRSAKTSTIWSQARSGRAAQEAQVPPGMSSNLLRETGLICGMQSRTAAGDAPKQNTPVVSTGANDPQLGARRAEEGRWKSFPASGKHEHAPRLGLDVLRVGEVPRPANAVHREEHVRHGSHRNTPVLDLHLLTAAVPHASEIDAPCLDRSACESMMIQNRRFRLLNVSVDGLLDGLSKSTTDLDLYSHNSISRAVAPGVNNCAKSE